MLLPTPAHSDLCPATPLQQVSQSPNGVGPARILQTGSRGLGGADAMRNQLKTGDADVRSMEAAQAASHLIGGAAKKREPSPAQEGPL